MSKAIIKAQEKERIKAELNQIKAEAKLEKSYMYLRPLKTLDTWSWYFTQMPKQWRQIRTSPENVIQRIIRANKKAFTFLGINASYDNSDGKHALILRTSKYAGCVPFCSPVNGNPVADLQIVGRYNESVGELLSLIQEDLTVDYNYELKLIGKTTLQSPFYIECIKFLECYLKAEHQPWQKFSVIERFDNIPVGMTNWQEYAIRTSIDPQSSLSFRNKRNIQSREHDEQWQMNYVLKICLDELISPRTPNRVKIKYNSAIKRLSVKILNSKRQETTSFKISNSDSLIIKDLKEQANVILGANVRNNVAWRIDYTTFFERFVQYLFKSIASTKSAHLYNNKHFTIQTSNRPRWALAYLEPDLILQKGNEQYVVDAKYKSHVFNWNDDSKELKDTFRHDFHQILAYCSLNGMTTKQAMLVYPFSDFVTHRMRINSPLTHSEAYVNLVGIPLEKSKIEEVKSKLNEIINL